MNKIITLSFLLIACLNVGFAQQNFHRIRSGNQSNLRLLGGLSSPTTYYVAGKPLEMHLTLTLINTDDEYGDSLAITLPAGFTIVSVTPNDSIGAAYDPTNISACPSSVTSGKAEPFNGISGQTISWGDNDNCFGGIATSNVGTYQITLFLAIDPAVTGIQTISYFISGDTWGADPADLSGTLTLNECPAPVINTVTLSFCSGDSVLAGNTYITQAGTYYDTLQAVSGCDSINEYIVNETTRPNLSITASADSVCSNSSVILTGSGATSLTWSDPNVFNGSPFYPVASVYYILTGYNNPGCEAKDSIYIFIKPVPTNLTAYVSQALPVCAGTVITHIASSDSYIKINNNGAESTLQTVVTSSFGSALPINTVTAAAELVNDGTPVTYDACETVINNLTGKVAIIERGACNFTVKCLNAQNAGAIAVIVINNQATANFPMAGTDPAITIPCMMISQADGAAIIAALQSAQTVTVSYGGAASSPSYTWTIDGIFVANTAEFQNTTTASYTLGLEANLNGCTTSASYFNTIYPAYHDTLYTTICQGDSVWAAGDYQYNTDVYYDSLTTSNGCDSITVTYLTVLPATSIPVVSVSADQNQVCQGGFVTLTASGADQYSWTHNGALSSSVGEIINQTTTYIVYGIDAASQCRDTAMITIQAKPLPTNLTASINIALPTCGGTNITHSATTDAFISVNNNGNESMIASIVSTSFGSAMPATVTTSNAALVDDATGVTYDGCESIQNDLTGKVAIIERGSCNFVVKCLNAQTAGAIAVIVVNNLATAPFNMSGSDPAITIPCMMISQADGAGIITALQAVQPVSITYGGAASQPVYSWTFGENGNVTTLIGNPVDYAPEGDYSLDIVADLNGCVTSVSYFNTIYPRYNDTLNVEVCSGTNYSFGGNNITVNGTYRDSSLTLNGCDSVTVLNIIFTNQITNTISEIVCSGESFVLGTQTLTSTGQYNETFVGNGGCDSVVTLNLTVLNVSESPGISIQADQTAVCEGNTVLLEGSGALNYTWTGYNNGSTLTASINGNTTFELVGYNNYAQCADTTQITISAKPVPGNLVVYSDVAFPVCAGTAITHTAAAEGLVTVSINTGPQTQIKGVHTSSFGSPLPVNATALAAALADDQSGVTYDACETVQNDLTGKIAIIERGSCNFVVKCSNAQNAGAVAVIVVDNQGAIPFAMGGTDPTITIPCIMISQVDGASIIAGLQNSDAVTITIGGMQNTPVYSWNVSEDNGATAGFSGNPFVYSPTSNYSLQVTADLNGCTASNNYYNTVNPALRDSIAIEACAGTTVIVGNLNITNNGQYVDTLQTTLGCDSIIVADVTFLNEIIHNSSASICNGDTYSFDGSFLSNAGEYRDTLQAAGGCDSIVVLNLTVNPVHFESTDRTICQGDFYPFGSQNPNQAGTYTETFTNSFGCDSTVTLNLSVNPLSYDTLDISICQGVSYTFGSQTIFATGQYDEYYVNYTGCDSIVTLNLTVQPVYFNQTTADICEGDTYTFNGQGFTASGVYEWPYASVWGCDSIVRLYLNVHPKHMDTLYVQACSGSGYSFNGNTITTDGIYVDNELNVNGCDSTIVLNISFVNSIENSISTSICSGDSYSFGGGMLNQAGVYNDTVQSTFGCDSVVILTLSLNPVHTVNTNTAICEGTAYIFGTQSITAAGIYTEVYTNSFGCDSTVNLTVSINPKPVVDLVAAMDTVCNNAGAITLIGTPSTGGAGNYSGNGVNGASFDPAGLNGQQTVYYSFFDTNNCYNLDSATIYVEICTGFAAAKNNVISLDPNPFSNGLTVSVESDRAVVMLTDVAGRVVIKENINHTAVLNTNDLVNGIYFVKIEVNNQIATYKVVKQ